MLKYLALLLISAPVWAGSNHASSDTRVHTGVDVDTTVGQSTVVGVGQKVVVSPEITTLAQSGDSISDSYANGGAASSDSTITISEDNPRQAPSVGLVAPPSSATRLKCVGIGGSEERGSALLGWCWKQQDDWARDRHDFLATLGLYTNAAKAYCSKRMHRKDFGTKAECEAGILQAHYDAESRANNQTFYEQQIQEREAELSHMREKARRMEEEMGGGKVLLADNSENEELKRIILAQERALQRLQQELDESEEDIDDLEEEVDDAEEAFLKWRAEQDRKLAPLREKYAAEG